MLSPRTIVMKLFMQKYHVHYVSIKLYCTHHSRVLHSEGVPDCARGGVDPAVVATGVLSSDVCQAEALLFLLQSVVECVLLGTILTI